ncbi:hypothetical protein BUALT_Bualt12G0097500 [Buddleja alternifolia]|uniref:Uncharacterized protein n=1 Tax=Buddleja alternifolia TaxID=168488 RepID=A0AAV6WQI6_9LAMI|nr:hypothetical protein BUALT_Bualt12G0097500 [Buddleja alternifolia]
MLKQEIRKSLDRQTILYTTLVELSKTLDLQNCAVWMPNAEKAEMNLTHELKGRNFSNVLPIPRSDPDVREIKENDGVKILDSELAFAVASSVRNQQYRSWSHQELEIVEVVADQVSVALFHASVLEESQLMREKLVEQNRALEQTKQDALMASFGFDMAPSEHSVSMVLWLVSGNVEIKFHIFDRSKITLQSSKNHVENNSLIYGFNANFGYQVLCCRGGLEDSIGTARAPHPSQVADL